MRSLGERLIAEFMQEHNGCLIFLDMDNLKKSMTFMDTWPVTAP